MHRPVAAALLLLLLLLPGCDRPAAAGPDPMALVDRYMAAWNAHDAAAAAALLADSVVYYDATVGVPQVGRDSARVNVIQAFLTAAPDCHWERDSAPPIVGRDGIAFQWTFSGTHTGPFADGTPATNRAFRFSGASLIRIVDGKIRYQGDYYDAYGFLKQLGLAQ